MKIVKLSDHIDYEKAVTEAIAHGWQSPIENSVAIVATKDDTAAVGEVLERLRHFAMPIIKGRAIKSHELDGSTFIVKLEEVSRG